MNNVNVTIRVNKDVKKQAEVLFNDLGLTLSSAINMFLRQAIADQAIPFKPAKKREMKYASRSELMKAAEEAYNEHPNLYKELAK